MLTKTYDFTYLDEGDKKPIVLLLHGEPTWSYLYRKNDSYLIEGF
jgi:pimeloyl-ACP methyl ester carboxylesterase